MAKQKLNTEPEKLEVSDFKEVEKPTEEKKVKLRAGEVLVAVLDENGNEKEEFVTNENTANTYYSDETKFKIKKN